MSSKRTPMNCKTFYIFEINTMTSVYHPGLVDKKKYNNCIKKEKMDVNLLSKFHDGYKIESRNEVLNSM
tara:strand:- start:2271 stop:2477 length:207 start_codon:yes stop_codon:yes gene_type:complete